MHRRELLKSIAASMLLPAALSPLEQLMAADVVASGNRLILIELTGANDGLNTLVPITNDHYHRLRPEIGLMQKEVISLDDEMALHQSLKPLMRLWERGELAWVQGLGYPQPNRSHFKSIALWETGGDGRRDARAGWMTHDIEHKLGRAVTDAHGISLKGDINLFASESGRWMSLQTTEQIESTRVPLPDTANASSAKKAAIDLVTNRMQELHHTMSSLAGKLASTPKTKRIGGGNLGAQLSHVVRLIRAGVDTPVYRVQLGGFDTHENQLGRHARLLKLLATAVSGLHRELAADGQWDQTLVMTYSEFGRRAAENGSGGTDHGTAAPHMLTGGAVRGGLFGSAPDLAQLIDGDPAFTMDYRALYQQVLMRWFNVDNNRFASHVDKRLQHLLS